MTEARSRRTYLRRRGRMTRAQARALEELAADYCVTSLDEPLDPARLFARTGPLGLEIGFGMGHGLLDWAVARPEWNLLGVEVYQPGIGAALLGIAREGVNNVRVVEAPAEAVLEAGLAPGSLDEVRIFFPDPWPKKRHHKRRLINADFARLLASRLRPGALLWVATDWQDYAEWIVEVLEDEPGLGREAPPQVSGSDGGRPPLRPATRFEARGLKLGHQVWDLRYRRVAEP